MVDTKRIQFSTCKHARYSPYEQWTQLDEIWCCAILSLLEAVWLSEIFQRSYLLSVFSLSWSKRSTGAPSVGCTAWGAPSVEQLWFSRTSMILDDIRLLFGKMNGTLPLDWPTMAGLLIFAVQVAVCGGYWTVELMICSTYDDTCLFTYAEVGELLLVHSR